MTLRTISNKIFELYGSSPLPIGRLLYGNDALTSGVIETSQNYSLAGITTGVWTTSIEHQKNSHRIISRMRVETGGVITVRLFSKKKKYYFKKSAGWKLRFSLLNKEGEDLLSIIPNVNWQKESHDFILQVNDEFETECNAFLILQAVHCANCSLSMMTGGDVPALVSL